jgi:hypothetical protein
MVTLIKENHYIRKFDGHLYAYYTTSTKNALEILAQNIRRSGHKARITKSSRGAYQLWVADQSHVAAWKKLIKERNEEIKKNGHW